MLSSFLVSWWQLVRRLIFTTMASNRVVTGQVLISHVEDESTQVELTLKHATKPTKPLKVALRMSEGEGEESYSRNSWVQGGILRDIGADLAEAVNLHTGLPTDGSPIRVADFGCSTGANAIAWAELTARSVQHNFRLRTSSPKLGPASKSPEIQHFFNDLPSNDWNTLFKALAASEQESSSAVRPYLAAAVAGSFHGRLFPKGSLHIAISTWSVHYLSKIPDALLDEFSPAYNRDRVWIDGGHPCAAQAYAGQARQDLFSFFAHRAHELAPAGLLFLMTMCRSEHARPEHQTSGEFINANVCGTLFEEAWQELVDQGVIMPQERNNFNAPVFHFSLEEFKEAITNTCAYNIKRLEIRRDHHWLAKGSKQAQNFKNNPKTFGQWAKGFVQAIYNPLVEAHLDPSRALKLWESLEYKTILYVKRTKNICLSMNGANYALIVLSRK